MNRLLVLDLSFLIHRAHFGHGFDMRSPKGTPTKAIYGALQWFFTFYHEYRPTHIIVALDSSTKSLERTKLYPEYKAGRNSSMSEEDAIGIKKQKKITAELLAKLTKPECCIKVAGWEADDVMASAAYSFKDDTQVCLAASDKDLNQVLFDNVLIYNPVKQEYTSAKSMSVRYGFPYDKFVFFQSLLGDSSDNIKGVVGVGEKTATALVQQFASDSEMFNSLDSVQSTKIRAKLQEQKGEFELSKKLVTLNTSLLDGRTLDDFRVERLRTKEILAYLMVLGIKKLQTY